MSSHPSQITIPHDASRLPVTLATIGERHKREAEVTSHPVEVGSDVTGKRPR